MVLIGFASFILLKMANFFSIKLSVDLIFITIVPMRLMLYTSTTDENNSRNPTIKA